MQSASTDRRLTRVLLVAVMTAAAVRVVASIVSGFATWATGRDDFPGGTERAGDVLSAFGVGGDTVEALLLVVALALLWRGFAGGVRPYRSWLGVLTSATVVLVVCRMIGLVLITWRFAAAPAAAQQAVAVGFGVADVVICAAVLAALRLLPEHAPDPDAEADDPVLFAVDRKTGEVFAFFSTAEARRSISNYSIEDEEFAFFDDEGHVVAAEVVDGWSTFTRTDTEQLEELLAHLRRFATAKGLDVDDRDDPLAYVQPINDWQWLELWPGWMRGIGRLSRRVQQSLS